MENTCISQLGGVAPFVSWLKCLQCVSAQSDSISIDCAYGPEEVQSLSVVPEQIAEELFVCVELHIHAAAGAKQMSDIGGKVPPLEGPPLI
jgi:hypothetical protein